MIYTYDPTADALYVSVSSDVIDHQVELTDGVITDIGVDGSLVGIDVMHPSSEWNAEEIITRHGLRPAEVDFLTALANVRSWSPARGPLMPDRTASHAVRDPRVEVLI